MSAVTRLAEPDSTTYSFVPIGVPVRRGRLHLGRLQLMFNTTEPLNVAVGFATAPNGGLLIVPVDEFARRWQAIS